MKTIMSLVTRALLAAVAVGLTAAYIGFAFHALGPMWHEAEYWLRVYTTLPRFST